VGKFFKAWIPRLLQTLQPAVAMNPDLKDAKIINVDLADMSAWVFPAAQRWVYHGLPLRITPLLLQAVFQTLRNDLG